MSGPVGALDAEISIALLTSQWGWKGKEGEAIR